MNFNWNELDNTLNVVEQLQATNSNKDKIAILEANKDDEMLQRVLNYTYDSFKKYGITERVFTIVLPLLVTQLYMETHSTCSIV